MFYFELYMKKNALVVGEIHSEKYDFKSIANLLKFKPDILIVEGPFDQMNSKRKNIIEDFLKSYPTFPKSFFLNIDKNEYLKLKGIPKDLKVYGIEDLNLASFRSAITLLCKNYYEIDDQSSKQLFSNDEKELEKEIRILFEEYRSKFVPLHSYLIKLSNERTYTKNEKKLIEWQASVVQSIIKQMDSAIREGKSLYQLTFLNQLRVTDIFEKQFYYHSHSTRNKIFVDSLTNIYSNYDNIGVIVGADHSKFIANNLRRMNYNIVY